MHVETLQPGRVRCHVCLARDSVLCDVLAGLPAGPVPSRSGTRPLSLLLAVGVKSAPSEGPHAEVSLRRVGDQDAAQGGKDLGLGVRASESDRAWGTGHVFVRKTPRNKVRGPGRWKRGGVCSVLDPGLWDGAGPGPASVTRPSPTPCGRDGRVQATWGAGSEERPRLCGGSLGMCLQVCPFAFSGLNIACILTASTLVTGSAAATRARSPGPGPGRCHGRGRLPRAATPAPPACSSACRPLLRCADPAGS